MPVVVSKVHNDRDKHGEGLIFIGFENVEEVVIFEEAHCSVCNLQVNSTNAPDDSLEELWDQVLYLVNFTHFQNFLQLSQEESLFDAVGKRPVFEKSLQKSNGEGSIFGKEKHGAPEKLFIELGACLHFVKGDNDILEENNMLVSEGNCKTTDDTCKNIKQLCSTIKFMSFMDQ